MFYAVAMDIYPREHIDIHGPFKRELGCDKKAAKIMSTHHGAVKMVFKICIHTNGSIKLKRYIDNRIAIHDFLLSYGMRKELNDEFIRKISMSEKISKENPGLSKSDLLAKSGTQYISRKKK